MVKLERTGEERGRGDPFTREELHELAGEMLPQRAATSLIDPRLGMPLAAGLDLAGVNVDAGEAAARGNAA